jgi:hypothetical protein
MAEAKKLENKMINIVSVYHKKKLKLTYDKFEFKKKQ